MLLPVLILILDPDFIKPAVWIFQRQIEFWLNWLMICISGTCLLHSAEEGYRFRTQRVMEWQFWHTFLALFMHCATSKRKQFWLIHESKFFFDQLWKFKNRKKSTHFIVMSNVLKHARIHLHTFCTLGVVKSGIGLSKIEWAFIHMSSKPTKSCPGYFCSFTSRSLTLFFPEKLDCTSSHKKFLQSVSI